jgi:hypothetical protein
MAIITDESTFFNTISFVAWTGQSSSSQGTQDFSSNFTTTTVVYAPVVSATELYSTAKLTHGFNTYYKMQGFNTATSRYEVWFSTNAPLLTPPSGHTLSNIEIVFSWIDR